MVQGENTTVVRLTLLRATGKVTLSLRPLCTYRDYHSHSRGGWPLSVEPVAAGCEIRAFDGAVPLRLTAEGAVFAARSEWHWNFRHRAETARGLDDREDLFVPGEFAAELHAGA